MKKEIKQNEVKKSIKKSKKIGASELEQFTEAVVDNTTEVSPVQKASQRQINIEKTKSIIRGLRKQFKNPFNPFNLR